MAVKQLAYEVDGWGIGELWREDGRVVWHELPHPSNVARKLGSDELVERLAELARTTIVGDPADPEAATGPVVNEQAVARFESSAGAARRGGVVGRGGAA